MLTVGFVLPKHFQIMGLAADSAFELAKISAGREVRSHPGALAYARQNPGAALTVEELAEVSHLSPRQFSQAPCTNGNRITNVVPSSPALSTAIVPPLFSTTSCVTARPRPVPLPAGLVV